MQSPRTFVAVMKGRAHAAKQAHENAVAGAWYTEVFARQKKLKSLNEYLASGDDKTVQPEVVLDAMMSLKAHGVSMEIRKVG